MVHLFRYFFRSNSVEMALFSSVLHGTRFLLHGTRRSTSIDDMKNVSTWKAEAAGRRERRIALHPTITLEALGEIVGLSASQLQRYERGKAAARADIIERWDAALCDIERRNRERVG